MSERKGCRPWWHRLLNRHVIIGKGYGPKIFSGSSIQWMPEDTASDPEVKEFSGSKPKELNTEGTMLPVDDEDIPNNDPDKNGTGPQDAKGAIKA